MFITSTTRQATSSDISDYDRFVQNRAANGHSSIQSHASAFRALGSTSAVDARDNTCTTGTGVSIHWLSGNKLADNYGDLYDNSWDETSFSGLRSEFGEGLGGASNSTRRVVDRKQRRRNEARRNAARELCTGQRTGHDRTSGFHRFLSDIWFLWRHW